MKLKLLHILVFKQTHNLIHLFIIAYLIIKVFLRSQRLQKLMKAKSFISQNLKIKYTTFITYVYKIQKHFKALLKAIKLFFNLVFSFKL